MGYFFKRMLKQLRSNIITGILVIFPLFITIFIIVKVFSWVDSALPGVFGAEWATGLGVLVILLIAYFTGILAKNYFGKRILAAGNKLISGIPILNKIYLGVQQIVDTVSLQNKRLFERVVLVEYPKANCYCIGFVTSEHNKEFSQKTGQNLIAVFIPTTPNPTSGFLLYYPESDVVDLNIPVEVAIKRVMSAGMLSDDQLIKPATGTGTGWNLMSLFRRTAKTETMFDPRD